MGHLARGLEWLRPLIMASKTWDYCVVWEIVDDRLPRSLEWVDCCCFGGKGVNESEEQGYFSASTAVCRDTVNPHPIRGKACASLALLPLSMPLLSGIRGEAILCGQFKWILGADISHSDPSHETEGTRVLIPVVDGLVELFSNTYVMKNQKTLDFIASLFNIYSKMESTASETCSGFVSSRENSNSSQHNQASNIWQPSFQQPLIPPLAGDPFSSLFRNHPKLERSSYGSIEHPSLNSGVSILTRNMSLKQSYDRSSSSKKRPQYNGNQSEHRVDFSSGYDNQTFGEGKERSIVSPGQDKKQGRSKNLVAERNRRLRLNRGLCDLRALVPHISKMNNAATVGDAMDYIVKLKENVKALREELEELEDDEEEDYRRTDVLKLSISDEGPRTSNWGGNQNHIDSHVEVNQLTARDFLLKIIAQSKRRAFTKLTLALDSLGLQVEDANVTYIDGMISNLLMVKANKREIEAGELKEFLIKLMG